MPLYANVGGAQKQPSALYANIGGAQKQSSSLLGNVGGASKELLELPRNYWVVPYSATGTMATNTRKRMVANSVTVASDGTFTLVSATSISGRPAAGTYYVSIGTAANSSATTGTVVYYAVNSSGSYYGFNATNWEASTSDPSASSSAYGDVDAICVSATLYVNKAKISSYYRWTQYNYQYIPVETVRSGSLSIYRGHIQSMYNASLVISGGNFQFTTNCMVDELISQPVGTYFAVYFSALESINAYRFNGNYAVSEQHGADFMDVYYDRYYEVGYSHTATGKYKFAISSSAYPTNGISGSYWYSSRTTVS